MKTKPTVTHISKDGFSLQVGAEELFLHFEDFPWFQSASLPAIFNVQFLNGYHLRWPDPSLDVDLELDSVRHPEKYPRRYRQVKYAVVIEKAGDRKSVV